MKKSLYLLLLSISATLIADQETANSSDIADSYDIRRDEQRRQNRLDDIRRWQRLQEEQQMAAQRRRNAQEDEQKAARRLQIENEEEAASLKRLETQKELDMQAQAKREQEQAQVKPQTSTIETTKPAQEQTLTNFPQTQPSQLPQAPNPQ